VEIKLKSVFENCSNEELFFIKGDCVSILFILKIDMSVNLSWILIILLNEGVKDPDWNNGREIEENLNEFDFEIFCIDRKCDKEKIHVVSIKC
jgi:hypothetical protein